MMYLQLAWRYTTRRLVNCIAILALALALAVQIVAMSVLDGMLVDLQRRLRNMGEQITLRFTWGELPHRNEFDQAGADLVRRVPGVTGITPLIQKIGFLETGGGAEYVRVRGIDLGEELAYSSLGEHLLNYRPSRSGPSWGGTGGRPGLFMGEQLANRLSVTPGMEIELFIGERGEGGGLDIRSRRFELTSLYRSGVFEKDRYGIYIPLTEAAEFYLGGDYDDPSDRVDTMVVWLADPNQAETLERTVEETVTGSLAALTGHDPGVVSDTWQRRWSEIARGMQHENNLMELVLFLNDAASGFCVFAILVTLVSRRIRDVGLLRCIGASRRAVMAVFLIVGLIIGVSGAALGVAAGTFLSGPLSLERVDGELRLAGGGAVDAPLRPGERAAERRPRIDWWYERITGQPLYPPRMFGTAGEAGLPTVIHPWKLAVYFAAAVMVSVLAALYPAAWAARREPMTALREG